MNTFLPIFSLILAIFGLLTASFGLWQIQSLLRLKKSFFAGKTAGDLEDVLLGISGQIKNMQTEQQSAGKKIQELFYRLGFTVQKVGVVKFNPFSDSGGNFSFSLALLDEQNSGIVLTSMHGREQNRIYTKILLGGKSEAKLTEEEQKAILEADGKFKALTKQF